LKKKYPLKKIKSIHTAQDNASSLTRRFLAAFAALEVGCE